MRYLAKYRLFLEEIEAENSGEIPPFDPKPADWIGKSDEEVEEVSSTQTQNKKDDSKAGNTSAETTKSDSGATAILTRIFEAINNAYDETSPTYFFRPYAFKLIDKIPKALEEFFGKNQFDKNSWWYGNVTSEMFRFIKGLKEAIDKNSLDSLKKEIDELPDTDKTKNHQRVGLLLLTQVYPKLKEATLFNDNSYRWTDPEGELGLEINVVPDFGVGDEPISDPKYDFKTKEGFNEELKKCAGELNTINLSGNYVLYLTLEKIVKMIDGLFKSDVLENSYGGFFNDKDNQAANWFSAQKNYTSNNILSPLIVKMNEHDFGSDSAAIKSYYTKQINRIKIELFDKIIKKMRGYFDTYDTVEFKLESFDKKRSVYVEVDTDF